MEYLEYFGYFLLTTTPFVAYFIGTMRLDVFIIQAIRSMTIHKGLVWKDEIKRMNAEEFTTFRDRVIDESVIYYQRLNQYTKHIAQLVVVIYILLVVWLLPMDKLSVMLNLFLIPYYLIHTTHGQFRREDIKLLEHHARMSVHESDATLRALYAALRREMSVEDILKIEKAIDKIRNNLGEVEGILKRVHSFEPHNIMLILVSISLLIDVINAVSHLL